MVSAFGKIKHCILRFSVGERVWEKIKQTLCFLFLLVMFPENEEKAEICSFHMISGGGTLKQTTSTMRLIKSPELATLHGNSIHF